MQPVAIYLSNQVAIPLTSLPDELEKHLRQSLVFANPQYFEREAKGFSTWRVPRYLSLLRKTQKYLFLPRGFMRGLLLYLHERKLPYQLIDQRSSLPPVIFKSKIKLYNWQEETLGQLLKKDFGVLEAPTGSGKTVMALEAIARRQQKTLVLVHTKELLEQWLERIAEFLSIPKSEIGVLGAGKRKIGKKITLGMFQTLRKLKNELARDAFGLIVADECHRVPARTFAMVVRYFGSRFMLGLTATPFRTDRLDRLIFFHIGEITASVKSKFLEEQEMIAPIQVIVRKTSFSYPLNSFETQTDLTEMLTGLIHDQVRNQQIVEDVLTEVSRGQYVIVLTERREHCELLSKLLEGKGATIEILYGAKTKLERKEITRELQAKNIQVIIATGQLLGEGFDCKHLSCLFLTFPFSSKLKTTQYIGRVRRTASGKTYAKIYDYLDTEVGILWGMFKKRARVYKQLDPEISRQLALL